MSFTEVLWRHFHNPVGAFRMEEPDAIGTAGNPARGNFMELFLRVEGRHITEASFQTYGCAPAIAAGSALCERLQGMTREEAQGLTAADVERLLGGLPPHKRHCATLAEDALREALEAWGGSLKAT